MTYFGVYIGQIGLFGVVVGALLFAITGDGRYALIAIAGVSIGFVGAGIFLFQQLLR